MKNVAIFVTSILYIVHYPKCHADKVPGSSRSSKGVDFSEIFTNSLSLFNDESLVSKDDDFHLGYLNPQLAPTHDKPKTTSRSLPKSSSTTTTTLRTTTSKKIHRTVKSTPVPVEVLSLRQRTTQSAASPHISEKTARTTNKTVMAKGRQHRLQLGSEQGSHHAAHQGSVQALQQKPLPGSQLVTTKGSQQVSQQQAKQGAQQGSHPGSHQVPQPVLQPGLQQAVQQRSQQGLQPGLQHRLQHRLHRLHDIPKIAKTLSDSKTDKGLLDLIFPASRVKSFKSLFNRIKTMLSYTFRK